MSTFCMHLAIMRADHLTQDYVLPKTWSVLADTQHRTNLGYENEKSEDEAIVP